MLGEGKVNKIVVAIYVDPDYFPPTINAILNMARDCREVVVITRNHSKYDFPYPGNVRLVKLGDLATVRESEKFSTLKKIVLFLQFTCRCWWEVAKGGTSLLVMYDSFPLFSFYLFRNFLFRKPLIWYHNHDMPTMHRLKKFSIGWFAAKYERAAMKRTDVFSLPSVDRLAYYPFWDKSGSYFTIPNYPSVNVYLPPAGKDIPRDEVRLIFQGFIGKGHALESIIRLLAEKIEGRSLRLVLKGSVSGEYKETLTGLAETAGVAERLTWVGIGPYAELRHLTASCDIGIGIHMNTDEVSKTLGTASNKIYEYAACALPVLLYDNEQFRKYLSGYQWTYFTDGTVDDLRIVLGKIIREQAMAGPLARNDFELGLNFEHGFQPAWQKIKARLT